MRCIVEQLLRVVTDVIEHTPLSATSDIACNVANRVQTLEQVPEHVVLTANGKYWPKNYNFLFIFLFIFYFFLPFWD